MRIVLSFLRGIMLNRFGFEWQLLPLITNVYIIVRVNNQC